MPTRAALRAALFVSYNKRSNSLKQRQSSCTPLIARYSAEKARQGECSEKRSSENISRNKGDDHHSPEIQHGEPHLESWPETLVDLARGYTPGNQG